MPGGKRMMKRIAPAVSPLVCSLSIALLLVVCGFSGPVAAEDRFAAWLAEFRSKAASAGISRSTLDLAFAGMTQDETVLDSFASQPESKLDTARYVAGVLSERRILVGREKLVALSGLLDRIETDFRVDRAIVLAIWGLESTYGENIGNRSVIRSLATLGSAGGPRASYGETQLIAALDILQRGDVGLADMSGSWAGAMGQTQLIPTTFRLNAIDYDGDGRRDVWTGIADALASTANVLVRSGWQPGLEWGFEIRLPAATVQRLAGGGRMSLGTARKLSNWRRLGVTRADGSQIPVGTSEASLWQPDGQSGPTFLVTRNFGTILRYNNSLSYALAIGLLSEAIEGRMVPWASDPDNPLSGTRPKE